MKLPIYASQSQCSAATGIPVEVLKRSKAAGCPGFAANARVDLEQFLRWHFAQAASEQINLRDEQLALAREKRIAQQMENEVTRGNLHTLAEVERQLWEGWLSPVREAWLNYRKTVAPQLQSILSSAGVAPEVIERTVEAACAGVELPVSVATERQTNQTETK